MTPAVLALEVLLKGSQVEKSPTLLYITVVRDILTINAGALTDFRLREKVQVNPHWKRTPARNGMQVMIKLVIFSTGLRNVTAPGQYGSSMKA